MADVNEMNLSLFAIVKAYNKQGNKLSDFNSTCYAKDVGISFGVDVLNGDDDLDQYGWLELVGTWASAPTDNRPTVDIYITERPDGSNYSSAPVTGGTDVYDQFVISIPIRKVTSAQRKVVGPILLPPHDAKFYIDNQTGQSLGSTWTLKLFRNNSESQ